MRILRISNRWGAIIGAAIQLTSTSCADEALTASSRSSSSVQQHPAVKIQRTIPWPTTKAQAVLRLPGEVGPTAFSPDGKLLVCASLTSTDRRNKSDANVQGTLSFWNVRTKKLVRRVLLHDRLQSLVYSPNGKLLIGGAATYTDISVEGRVLVWNAVTGKLLHVLHSGVGSPIARTG